MTLHRQVEATDSGSATNDLLNTIQQGKLHSVFQPIVDLRTGGVLGHEGLIRGPVGSALHFPQSLFQLAKEQNQLYQLELLSIQTALQAFSQSTNSNKIFVNVSPECLLGFYEDKLLSLSYINDLGLSPENIVLELTEGSPIFDYANLYSVINSYRSIGFKVALDDLGEGFSSLRLWSELQPDYVKIDKHFIKSINLDPVKLQFVKSIQQIAENSGAQVIAEGVETEAELAIVKDLNIAYCQGYLLGRPQLDPIAEIPENYQSIFHSSVISVFPNATNTSTTHTKASVSRLLVNVPIVAAESTNDEVYALFQNNPSLYSIPVVAGDLPLGLISRYSMIDRFLSPMVESCMANALAPSLWIKIH
jgi:EAL domain-containing protein (putative c-di-GMP-specific phosphodiesterase class I)